MKTLRQMIVSDEKYVEFMRQYHAIPQRIQDCQDSFDQANQQVSEFHDDTLIQEQLDIIEGETYFEVRDEKLDNGKPKYTNEDQRKLAVISICSKDTAYVALKDKLWAAKKAKSDLKMHCGKLNNMVKYLYNTQRVMEATANMIAGLSHESAAELNLGLIDQCVNEISEEKDDEKQDV